MAKKIMEPLRAAARENILQATEAFKQAINAPLPAGAWGDAVKVTKENVASFHLRWVKSLEAILTAGAGMPVHLGKEYPLAAAIVVLKQGGGHNYTVGGTYVCVFSNQAIGLKGCAGNNLPFPKKELVRAATPAEVAAWVEQASQESILQVATALSHPRMCTRQRASQGPDSGDDEDDIEEDDE